MKEKVDIYIQNSQQWREEFEKLRTILLDCKLKEEYKWGKACYTFQEKNILILQEYSAYCTIMFFKGALIKDTENIFRLAGKSITPRRQIRFTNVQEVEKLKPIIKKYVKEAIGIEKNGLIVEPIKVSELEIPNELIHQFEENPEFKVAFDRLSQGRQKGYLIHFSNALKTKTKRARIEKCKQSILKKTNLNVS